MGELAIHPLFPTCHPQAKPRGGSGDGVSRNGLLGARNGKDGPGEGGRRHAASCLDGARGQQCQDKTGVLAPRPVVSLLS